MSYHADVQLNPRQLEKLKTQLKLLQGSAIRAGRDAVIEMAEAFALDVRTRYVTGAGLAPLAQGTLQVRQQGKRAGATPAIPPRPGTQPLSRSGMLASLVTIKKTGGSKTATVRVHIKPGLPLPGGGLSDRIAATHEFGQTVTFLATPRVRAYLLALALGVAGTNTPVSVSNESVTIVTRIPARPIWMPALADLFAEQPFGAQGFGTIFAKHFKKRTGLPVVFKNG